jgi:hypothetical protein
LALPSALDRLAKKNWSSIFCSIVIDELKMFHFQPKSFISGFNKIWHIVCSFGMNDSEQNEAYKHFMLKKAKFSVIALPTTN